MCRAVECGFLTKRWRPNFFSSLNRLKPGVRSGVSRVRAACNDNALSRMTGKNILDLLLYVIVVRLCLTMRWRWGQVDAGDFHCFLAIEFHFKPQYFSIGRGLACRDYFKLLYLQIFFNINCNASSWLQTEVLFSNCNKCAKLSNFYSRSFVVKISGFAFGALCQLWLSRH